MWWWLCLQHNVTNVVLAMKNFSYKCKLFKCTLLWFYCYTILKLIIMQVRMVLGFFVSGSFLYNNSVISTLFSSIYQHNWWLFAVYLHLYHLFLLRKSLINRMIRGFPFYFILTVTVNKWPLSLTHGKPGNNKIFKSNCKIRKTIIDGQRIVVNCCQT